MTENRTEKSQEEKRETLPFAEQIRKVNASNPFMRHNGITARELDAAHALVTAEVDENARNAMGSVHGGLMFIMAEIAAGLLVRSDGRRYVTLDSSFHFISGAPGTCKEITAQALLTKRGRTVAFARASVSDPENGRILGEGDFTFYCLDA